MPARRSCALTRFPVDAAQRYAQEPDFADFRARLQIHGLDLRHTPSVELFARWLGEQLPRLDYILNNACQTVRRPAGFFRHLLEREADRLRSAAAGLRAPLAAARRAAPRVAGRFPTQAAGTGGRDHDGARGYPEGLVHSAALSQRRYLDEDYLDGEALFPAAVTTRTASRSTCAR